MSKYPNWTQSELNKLENLLNNHIPKSEISKILNRSIKGINWVCFKKLHYKPLCLDCNKKINRKVNRLRCEPCSIIHIKKNKAIYAKENAKYFSNLKNETRFGGNRQKALERDNYTCQICKKTHHEVMLNVHHKDKKGRNKKIQNHNLDNLHTLCHCCHTKIHKEDTILKRWEPQLFSNKNWLYNEYILKKRTSCDIAKDFKVTGGAIIFWLRKYKIPRRNTSQTRQIKYWSNGNREAITA